MATRTAPVGITINPLASPDTGVPNPLSRT